MIAVRQLAFFLLAGSLAAQSKLSPDLLSGKDSDELDVIVQLKPGADPDAMATKARGWMKSRMDSVGMAVLKVSRGQMRQLEKDPDLVYASPDRAVKGTSYFQHLLRGYSVGLPMYPTASTMGTGVGVAIIDSGITDGPYFRDGSCNASRIVYSENFVTGENTTADPYGHGSHVAGIAGGMGKCLITQNDGSHISGMAPGINIYNMRVLNAQGSGSDSTVIKAIDKVLSLRSKTPSKIRVINLSLGRPIYESFTTDPLCQAVEKAWKAGVTVVVAAGNNGRDNTNGTQGYGTIASPGNDPYVITVGAARNGSDIVYRTDDTVATYSSKGPTSVDKVVKPDLVAPGNQVYAVIAPTAYLAGTYGANLGSITVGSEPINSNFRLSGTSMAAPVVAGGVALMLQADSGLTPDQIKARLMKTAYKGLAPAATVDSGSGVYYVNHDIFALGAGFVDLGAALASTDKIPNSQRALSPRVVLVSGAPKLSYDYSAIKVSASSICWGSSVIWGENVVWGTNVVGTSVVNGSSVIWGETTARGYSVIWGESFPSGASNPFSESLSIQGDQN